MPGFPQSRFPTSYLRDPILGLKFKDVAVFIPGQAEAGVFDQVWAYLRTLILATLTQDLAM